MELCWASEDGAGGVLTSVQDADLVSGGVRGSCQRCGSGYGGLGRTFIPGLTRPNNSKLNLRLYGIE